MKMEEVTWQLAHITSAEAAGLMHVNPQAIKWQLAVQTLNL